MKYKKRLHVIFKGYKNIEFKIGKEKYILNDMKKIKCFYNEFEKFYNWCKNWQPYIEYFEKFNKKN